MTARLAVLLALVAGLIAAAPSAALGRTQAGQWLTLPQAKKLVLSEPVYLSYCTSGDVGEQGTCYAGRESVQLRIISGTVKGYGPSRLKPKAKAKTRQWRSFLVTATCGSDRLSGRQFRSKPFIWEWFAGRLEAEGTDPKSPDYSGAALLGC